MRIVVTGGAGFIGGHIVDALVALGHEVCVVDDLSSGRRENLNPKARFAQLDIRNRAELHALIADFKPDVVNHQAAQTSVSVSTREPVRDAEINIIGSIHLFDACADHKVKRVVFASTGGAIYGEVPEGKAADTDWVPAPQSPYACAKYSVEQYLRGYRIERGLQSNVLRYANVYGPRQDPHGEAGVVAIFSRRLLNGEPIQVNARREVGDEGCIRDYVYVGDVVKANLLACDGRLSATLTNVGTGVGTSTLALARALEGALGVRANLGFGSRRAGDVERSILAPAATLAAPASLADGVRQTADWFRTQS